MRKGKNIIEHEEEEEPITSEGQVLWDNIKKYERILEDMSSISEQTDEKPMTPSELELLFIRGELKRLIRNSELVIEQCDIIIAKYTTIKEYLASDAKVAKQIHTNIMIRLGRVLEYKHAM